MPLPKSLFKTIATCLNIGYLPFMPGTFGTLLGVLIYFLVKDNVSYYLAALISIILLGFLTTGRVEQMEHKKDPGYIVIDEVSGMLLSLLFISYDLKLVLTGFFLFRALDIIKPYPIRKLQALKGSLGVMSDDLLAGIYTNVILQIALRLTSFRAS